MIVNGLKLYGTSSVYLTKNYWTYVLWFFWGKH